MSFNDLIKKEAEQRKAAVTPQTSAQQPAGAPPAPAKTADAEDKDAAARG